MYNIQSQPHRESTSINYQAENKGRYWRRLILGVALLLLLGAGIVAGIYYWDTIRHIPLSIQIPKHEDPLAGWVTYANSKYQFQFRYPPDHTVYTGINKQQNGLLPATADSVKLKIAEDEKLTLCCSANELTFETVTSALPYRDWLDINYKKYSAKPASSVSDGIFAGRPARVAVSSDSQSSLFKLIVLRNDDKLLVISQKLDSKLFDQILATFKFTGLGSDWLSYKDIQSRYEIKYPTDWKYKSIDLNKVDFYPASEAGRHEKYVGDITVEVLNNPNRWDLREFYQNYRFDLYENSLRQTALEINGLPAEKFGWVEGEITYDVISILKDNRIIEITDMGQVHADDQILDIMANSLK